MANLHGVCLALQTPFNNNGSINYDRFAELIDGYIEAGVHGMVVSSGSGQHPYLTEDECNKLLAIAVKRIDGRASVIMQTSALNQDEVIRRSVAAQSLGAEALMILPPFFEGPSHDAGILKFYETIDKAVSIDIIGYNIPAATQVEVSPSLYRQLLELENFNYIKDSGGDLAKTQQLIAVGGRVLNGADTIAPFAFMAGAVGAIWGGANFMPRECVELYDLVKANEYQKAMTLWAKMFPSLAYIWDNDYIPAVKAACRNMGFDGGTVRAPLTEISKESEASLIQALAHLK
ncbi:dihydrodipicolinate synthase family protein [Oceanimonas doudoroffii]|uniref:Dihydrodipicolinate synthase family protein n=1 Tax=Oceanimonas doudoroffii TaxID=84158 RepID=A0A233RIH7_9GAMM|nr:dihydrodipicolinate synthase family protein [Oceanimonas doudoroffii]OXY83196.1 dihydrodipicolinate synthase family protein [Oceanimonas doudoroffii]